MRHTTLALLIHTIALRAVLSPCEKTTFNFSPDPIDAVILCAPKDVHTLDLCIQGIQKHCGARRIIVVSPERFTHQAEWYDETGYPFSKDDIALALMGSLENATNYKQSPQSRLGWIAQQLFKLYAPLVIPHISANVLIVDADTIFLKPTTFIGPEGAALFTPAQEYNAAYFAHAQRLLPYLYKLDAASGVSHHMLFQRCVIEDLKKAVETYHQKPFWQAFTACIDPHENCGASEYEIYFNYARLRSDQFTVRPLVWHSTTWQEIVLVNFDPGYHYISIHSYA